MSKQQNPQQDGPISPKGQELVDALEILKEVLVDREISAVRSLVGDAKADLSRRLSEAVDKSSDSLATVTKDFASRIDALKPQLNSLEKKQQAELVEAREEIESSVDDLKKELRESQDQSKSQMRSLKEEMQEMIADKGAEFKSEVDRLSQGLMALQNSVREQAAQSQQISGLLQNMGAVFAGAAPVPVQEDSLEDALDEMFQEVDTSVVQPEAAQD